MYNLLNCKGFEATKGWVASGDCMSGRIGVVLLFFIMALIRKWGGEEIGVEFNMWLATGGSILVHIILMSIFGNFKIAFLIALIGGIALGYGGGALFGEWGDGGDYD